MRPCARRTPPRVSEPPLPFAGLTGAGVRIAVVDSGIHAEHPHIEAMRLAPGIAIAPDGTIESGAEATRDRLRHGTAVAAAIQSFPGLAHRMEAVGRIGKTAFINDSKATNADATARALAVYPDIFWIAGGKPKDGGIESLSGYFPRIRKAYLIGEAAPAFARSLDGKAPYAMSGTLDTALASAAADAAASNASAPVVLLSPACASYDQFRDFEQRGDAFRAAVARLPGLEKVA